jgi:hypothetical protein
MDAGQIIFFSVINVNEIFKHPKKIGTSFLLLLTDCKKADCFLCDVTIYSILLIAYLSN